MLKNIITLIVIFLLAAPGSIQAQSQARDKVVMFNISYGIQFPKIDLDDRFGKSFNVGIGIEFMPDSSRLIIGLEGFYLFGNIVKDDPIANLRTSSNIIVGSDARFSAISPKQRGYYGGGHIGMLFPVLENNPRSGIKVMAGAGILFNKIRLQDNSKNALQIEGDYLKLYDHLSRGMAFHQFIGYQHLSSNRMINFFAGIEFNEAIVQNIRTYNMDIGGKDENTYVDMRIGLKVGWTLPFYLTASKEEVYY